MISSTVGLNRGRGQYLNFCRCSNAFITQKVKFLAVNASLRWLNNVSVVKKNHCSRKKGLVLFLGLKLTRPGIKSQIHLVRQSLLHVELSLTFLCVCYEWRYTKKNERMRLHRWGNLWCTLAPAIYRLFPCYVNYTISVTKTSAL